MTRAISTDRHSYFDSFTGASECGIYAHDLYKTPVRDEDGSYARKAFCPNRGTLLQAMSSGGRVGFDAPYNSKGMKLHCVLFLADILRLLLSLVHGCRDLYDP